MSLIDVHLLVLVHGMWGNPGHLAEMKRIMLETRGPEGSKRKDGDIPLELLVAHSNRDESTYDGIDWGGERIADEILKRVKDLESDGKAVVRFSITGYSLGGLLARYVIGILSTRSFFATIKPVNFTTIATPHIGLIRTGSLWTAITSRIGPTLLSRTGEQFFGVDRWGTTGRSLLEVMADPKEIFYQALSDFPHVNIYGNAVNDSTVAYTTALIETHDPFVTRSDTGINVEFDPEYEPIMLSYSIPEVPPKKEKKPRPFSWIWWKEFKVNNYLPPFLAALRSPYNTIAFISLPILVPTFLILLLIRLAKSSHRSRRRIKLLEKDSDLQENALVHAFHKLENDIERAVIDVIENNQGGRPEPGHRPSYQVVDNDHAKAFDANGNGVSSASAIQESASSSATRINTTPAKPTISISSSEPLVASDDDNAKKKQKLHTHQPRLAPTQVKMAEMLNTLSQLRKHYVFIDPVRNSHATIIARDVKSFEFHKRGWGVLRHWADGFVL